ncbi:MAG TPA: DUF6790 family protein [Solirubrobacterales bacterium]|nr:DUF6790 family protein [Solirubrobacterales bacterium]
MLAATPTLVLVLAWAFAVFDLTPPGADSGVAFDEAALRWVLYLALGWTGVVSGLMHTVFARRVASSIGWQTSGFQYEVGFANLGIGLGAIYAASQDAPEAWVAASIAGGTFLLLAAANHVREIAADRNLAPGNTVILLSDFGTPLSLLALLIATKAI